MCYLLDIDQYLAIGARYIDRDPLRVDEVHFPA